MKVAFKTLGCKVNQYETYAIAQEFRDYGFDVVEFEEDADIYIINTCAVTQTAEKKSRQMIRHVSKKGFTVVTGCGVEKSPLSYFSIEGVDLVIGNVDKDQIYKLALERQRGIFLNNKWHRRYTYFNFPSYTEKTRAYIKIQDGCNRFCAYCKIPYFRGEERSRNPDDFFFELESLLKRGFKEINLLGINLGTYNYKGYKLYNLLKDLEELKEEFWIRLSSIEPEDVRSLFPIIENAKKLVPHIHIPLQSGDNYILKKMRRKYTREFFTELVGDLRKISPHISITSDIIVGFPGEERKHFLNSYELLERLSFYKFHIFPYSRRENTPAYYMNDNVSKKEKAERVDILKKLRDELILKYHKKFIGKKVKILIEGLKNGKMPYGMSPYYFKVYIKNGQGIAPGRFYTVYIEDIYSDGLVGKI